MHPEVIASTHPDRLALIMATGETRTYRQLAAAGWRIARLLRRLGLRPGDHVALCMDNGPEMLEVLWGAHSAGLLYTACSTRLTAGDLAYVVDDCDAQAFIVSAGHAEHAQAIVEATPKVAQRFSVGGAIAGHVALEQAIEREPPAPLDGAVAGAAMLYSSGTTGRPKGIETSSVGDTLYAPDLYTGVMRQVLGFASGDVYLSPAPLYHTAPLRGCMSVHRLGGTVVLLRRFDAESVLRLIEAHRVTHGQFVPTMFVRLLRLPPEVRERYDLSSLRSVVHGAAPCPVEIKRAMIEWWGPIVNEYYGATEAVGTTGITSEQWLAHPGSVGPALVGTLHVVDDDTGAELPPGEDGTIYFSGGPSFQYHKDPEKTADAHNAEGWATTGDIGHLDEDGYLYLTDRKANLVISGGVNVYPQEAEDALITHPLVLDAAVFGVPDDDLGERLTAAVQPVRMPADDVEAAELEETLLTHLRRSLAAYKHPREIVLLSELPRHDTGKLYKRLLADEYRASLT